MKSQRPATRKLHIPGKPDFTYAAPLLPATVLPAQRTPLEPLAACVAPRERFIKRFIAVTALLTLLGNLIFTTRCCFSGVLNDIYIFIDLGTYAMFEAPIFVILLLPSRTSSSTLLRLIGLVLPLLVTLAACGLSGAETHLGWGYGVFIFLLCINGILFFYLPGYLLHYAFLFISRHRHDRQGTNSTH
ncbi:MAG: hypothetical protein Q4F35_00740 [Akkermansia sp.]|nr:hypothetical protein [Akkermansia sp.]